ncbi:c-type cytochrome [Nisaea nitritireducens]|uniref:c-type cytochrome n=1 Tax=Nisaea nitritireducens TaxID=568392 RepID=UPI001867A365|nr:c-type cytochrome [Nisaea nitritireducens]
MRRAILLGLGGLMLAGAAPAFSGDPAAGRKVANMCRTCHGLDGFARIPIAPHIGGEPESYLQRQLRAFKSGARRHEMMTVVASGLSERQMDDVSAWYAAHKATASLPAGTDPANAPEACTACHGVDGIALFEDAPNLAGETNIYIDTQLKAFKRGKRTHEIMNGIAEAMSDEEIRAAADWYASVEFKVDAATK